MSEPGPSASTTSASRGRGRGKSRGGLGKYLRARGRGRGYGRPAEFHQRLVLEDEAAVEEDDEEKAERERKFSKRHLGTNADRYAEPDPELDSDGEPIIEPEVDLSSFLQRQKLSDNPGSSLQTIPPDNNDDIDHSLAHISSRGIGSEAPSRKGKVEQIVWDDELDELSREKAVADANRDLKSRFRAKSERLRKKPTAPTARERKQEASYVSAPALPLPEGAAPKDPKADMEDFLDNLLG
ncbi:uncharacterized protein BT62DRAFT_934772 [Guyanagaster necrorhizus]|uniref:Uncharacterized protein n=1 Tax=Guyanagaster necrorhizus TaxID=856835 RepID=A0A9P7VPT3_9AGAR|nr:uncharacterized protein BT62DRAFT_934772 [Guyanagaster necrorhizus MCA 3950]KAG7443816.1 hypothetical protein BT62DRAFT_934772 [Guyanagaster necrorhizus MCA 3950]